MLVHLPLPLVVAVDSWQLLPASGWLVAEWYDLEATEVVPSCFSVFNDQPDETPRRHPGPSPVR